MSNAKTQENVVYVARELDEPNSSFATLSYSLMYAGPLIQTALIFAVGFLGYGWVKTGLEYTNWMVNLGAVTKTPQDIMLTTQGWLIFASYFFMIIQIVGALMMPFNIKVSHVVTVGLSIIPIVSLLYVVFSFMHLNLKLDSLQRIVLWFQFWSVIGGFLLGLGTRMAIMSGRKTGTIVGS